MVLFVVCWLVFLAQSPAGGYIRAEFAGWTNTRHYIDRHACSDEPAWQKSYNIDRFVFVLFLFLACIPQGDLIEPFGVHPLSPRRDVLKFRCLPGPCPLSLSLMSVHLVCDASHSLLLVYCGAYQRPYYTVFGRMFMLNGTLMQDKTTAFKILQLLIQHRGHQMAEKSALIYDFLHLLGEKKYIHFAFPSLSHSLSLSVQDM